MAVVESIINNAIAFGGLKAAQSEAYGGQAFNSAVGGHTYSFEQPDEVRVDEPNIAIPSRAAGIDQALWDTTYQKIVDDLGGKFGDFLIEFFPVDAGLMTAVESWLKSAIVDGGSGINATVEGRTWQRSRDRITTQSMTEKEDAIAIWASRGFPLPPGAANATISAISTKESAEVAAVSRDAAIKAFDTEIENVRFAVTTAIDYRRSAMAAAGDYLRAMALGPQLATQIATSASDAQARLIGAVSSFYGARINAAELAQRRGIAVMDAELRQTIAAGDNKAKYTELKVNAAVSTMQSLGQQASAALNGVNATSQLIESV